MEINVIEFKKYCEAVEGSIVMKALYKAEITPKKCSNCSEPESLKFSDPKNKCTYCTHNPHFRDNFKIGKTELDKIFINAPVMLCNNSSNGCIGSIFKGPCELTEYHYRLPTIEEAPKNIWLCPWLEIPEILVLHAVLLWPKNGNIRFMPKGACTKNSVNWDNIVKLQIIEE